LSSKRNGIAHQRPRNGSQRYRYCPNLKLATRRARISGIPPTTARVDRNNANLSSAAVSPGLNADLPPALTRRRAKPNGLRNSQVGRALGIYAGHVGHEGHISRTLLAMLEAEGLLRQEASSKKWFVNNLKHLPKGNEIGDG
jgi:hypothetical protein